MRTLRNYVQINGNLGQDVEVKTLESGKKVANFSIAVNSSYKNAAGEKVENTDWFNVTAWEKTAELMGDLLKKGSSVMIAGSLTTRSYDKEGQTFNVVEIRAEEFFLNGGKNAE